MKLKLAHLTLPLLAGSSLLLSSCAVLGSEAREARRQARLDAKEERINHTFDRMKPKPGPEGSRWSRMKEWENRRYERLWDRLMN